MDREQFNGAWQLMAAEYRCTDGSVINPFGKNPSGLLIYSADGYLSVQVGRRDRKPFAVDDMASAAPEEIRAAFTSYFSYFGRFTVDEPARLITQVDRDLGALVAGEVVQQDTRIDQGAAHG